MLLDSLDYFYLFIEYTHTYIVKTIMILSWAINIAHPHSTYLVKEPESPIQTHTTGWAIKSITLTLKSFKFAYNSVNIYRYYSE